MDGYKKTSGQIKILIVDSEPASLLNAEVLLEELCDEVVRARSAEEALREVVLPDYAIVLLAYRPGTLELAQRIRAFSRTPMMFVAPSETSDFPLAQVYALGAVDHVYMPVVPEILRGKATLLIDLHQKNRKIDQLEQERQITLARSKKQPTADFLSKLAHELRNPLAPIRSGLSIIRLSGSNPEVLEKMREMMERQVSQMVHLIDALLEMSKITSGKVELNKERGDVNAMVTSAVQSCIPMIEAAGHSLQIHLPHEVLFADMDTIKLSQALSKILNNAAKYTPSGGTIELRVAQEAANVVISVKDDGIGIEKESIATIFDMFHHASGSSGRAQGGLGIGLSLVRQIVEMHGGSVGVESAGTDAGSTFIIRLPLAAENKSALPAGEQPSRRANVVDVKRCKVLVVDDNLDAANSLSDLLELDGHTIRVAYSGTEAIKVAQDFRPDVVLLDIGMPGMDGYDVAQAMRKLPGLEKVALVAVTGWSTERARDQAKKAGFDHHLTKPIELGAVDAFLLKLGQMKGVNAG